MNNKSVPSLAGTADNFSLVILVLFVSKIDC